MSSGIMADTGVWRIEPLGPDVDEADLIGLTDLLIDAVDSGAAVSFLAPLSTDDAMAWWRGVVGSMAAGACVLIARDRDGIVGTVQLHPAWAPNQPHRADVAKLLVHRRGRGAGLGAALMRAIEVVAQERGFTLLTLDARCGGAAERVYRRLGWTEVGVIPRFAYDTDGIGLHDDVLFYKELPKG